MSLTANEQSFAREVLDNSRPVVVCFWSQHCGHCLRFHPQFEEAAQEAGGPVKFANVSTQEAPALFQRFEVSATPTLLLFRGGIELARHPGYMNKYELLSWLRQTLSAAEEAASED